MPRILLIESNPQLICLTTEVLRVDLGLEVYHAQTGPWALQMLAAADFDFALISVMPDEAGFRLAQQATDKCVAVLLTSGHPLTIAKLEMFGYPHLAKPYRMSELLSRIIHIMKYPTQNIAAVKTSAAMQVLHGTLDEVRHKPIRVTTW